MMTQDWTYKKQILRQLVIKEHTKNKTKGASELVIRALMGLTTSQSDPPGARMILGDKFRSWANFPWFSPKKIHYSKNDSPKFYTIKLFYLKNCQNFIQTI
jgi:hypothetical protein